MPIDLYYQSESPPSRTVLMVAKHLKIPVNIKLMNVLEGDQFKPEFLEVFIRELSKYNYKNMLFIIPVAQQ